MIMIMILKLFIGWDNRTDIRQVQIRNSLVEEENYIYYLPL